MFQTMMPGKNKFVVVAPMFNAAKTLPKMLHSLYGQSYDNWRLILIDDVSDENQKLVCQDWIQRFDDLDPGKVTIVWNAEKRWEVANVLHGISMCEDNDIVVRVDADDFLCDLDAFRAIDLVYNQENCDCLWTAHRWFDAERLTSNNISGPMPDNVDPYKFPWVSSHLKSFRKYLINNVNDINFRGPDNEYVRRAGDQCVFLPILNIAKKRVYFPMVTYAYRCDMKPQTFQTDDARFQKLEAEFIRSRGYVK